MINYFKITKHTTFEEQRGRAINIGTKAFGKTAIAKDFLTWAGYKIKKHIPIEEKYLRYLVIAASSAYNNEFDLSSYPVRFSQSTFKVSLLIKYNWKTHEQIRGTMITYEF